MDTDQTEREIFEPGEYLMAAGAVACSGVLDDGCSEPHVTMFLKVQSFDNRGEECQHIFAFDPNDFLRFAVYGAAQAQQTVDVMVAKLIERTEAQMAQMEVAEGDSARPKFTPYL